jgi:Divergent InlB B-repeat domain
LRGGKLATEWPLISPGEACGIAYAIELHLWRFPRDRADLAGTLADEVAPLQAQSGSTCKHYSLLHEAMAQQDESSGPNGETPERPPSPWAGWTLVKVLAVAVFALAVSGAVLRGLTDGGGGGEGAPADGGGAKRTEPLNVDTDGEGSGGVISDPSGINCGQDCAQEFPAGKQVVLTARPSKGSIFAGFSGDCSGTDQCTVIMNAARSVTATFEPD